MCRRNRPSLATVKQVRNRDNRRTNRRTSRDNALKIDRFEFSCGNQALACEQAHLVLRSNQQVLRCAQEGKQVSRHRLAPSCLLYNRWLVWFALIVEPAI